MPLEFITEKKWAVNAWINPFKSTAIDAFCDYERDRCCNFKVKCPLSTIIFGKGTFTGAEAFKPGSISSGELYTGDGTTRILACQALLASSVLKPCLKFIDRGVMFALQAARRINDCWSIGARASIPYRSFKITYPNTGATNTSLFGGQTRSNQIATKTETVNGTTVRSYAYRLDFLSGLPIGCT